MQISDTLAVNSQYARHMIDFCHDNNYNISTRLMLPDDSYTHVSEAWGTVSWLDHIVSSSDFHDNITNRPPILTLTMTAQM